MSYTALYRKFRPKTFEDVKGQDPIVTTLKNQIINGRMSHAYLFTGTRGTGKTSVAKILGKAVNCLNPKDGSPCLECEVCKGIADGSFMNVIEMDAASNNGVDAVRMIIDEVSYSPATGKYKVYIIDEVHMMSTGAFNALLKTLEEPPAYVIFILATTEVNKLPITILSRCQRYDFRRISAETISDRIRELIKAESVSIEDRAIRYIARTADGSMRDALSLLDQCIAFYYGQELTYDKVLDVLGAVDTEVFSSMLRALLGGDVQKSLKLLEEIIYQGRELTQFVTDMTWYLRNLMLLKLSDANEDIIDLSSENMARLKEEASMTPHEAIVRYIRIFSDLSNQIRYSTQKRVLVEIALIKLCRPQMETDNDSLAERIRFVEDKIENGVVVSSHYENNTDSPASPKAVEMTQAQKEALVKALPEDVKEAVAKWGQIVAECEDVFSKYLDGSYPSIEGEDVLAIIVRSPYSAMKFGEPDVLEDLRMNISSILGKDIKISVRYVDEANSADGTFPDLRTMVDDQIDFEIEEVDPSEEEDDDDDDDDYENYKDLDD